LVIIIIVLSAVLTIFKIGRPRIFLKDAKEGAAAPPHPLNPPLDWGSAPDPAEGAYSAPPDSLAGFKGPTSKGGEGRKYRREGQASEKGGDLLLKRGERGGG